MWLHILIAEILSKDSVSSNDSECNTKIAFLVLGTFLTSASFFIVSAISFDRFLAFTLHLCYREIVTERKVTITISVLRTLSAVTSVGYLLIGDMNREVLSIAFTITFLVTTTITFVEIHLAVPRNRSSKSTSLSPVIVRKYQRKRDTQAKIAKTWLWEKEILSPPITGKIKFRFPLTVIYIGFDTKWYQSS